MTPRLALVALMTLPLAACEGVSLPGMGRDTAAPAAQGHQGPPGVSPLQQPIETGTEARPVSTAEASTYNTPAFSARGNEPFWAVDAAGGTAIYKTPDNPNGRPIRVNRLNFAGGVEYVGVLGGRPFVLNLRAAACEDSMSGDDFPFVARLTVSGRTQAGCAAPATAEIAQAVAATRAPAPPAPRQAAPAVTRPAATRPAATRPAPAETPAPAATPAATPAPADPAPDAAPARTAPAPAAPEPAAATPPAGSAPAPAPEGTADLPPPPASGGTAPAAPATVVPPIRVLPPLTTGGAAPAPAAGTAAEDAAAE